MMVWWVLSMSESVKNRSSFHWFWERKRSTVHNATVAAIDHFQHLGMVMDTKPKQRRERKEKKKRLSHFLFFKRISSDCTFEENSNLWMLIKPSQHFSTKVLFRLFSLPVLYADGATQLCSTKAKLKKNSLHDCETRSLASRNCLY